MTADEYLTRFLEWHISHPNEPFRDWSGLVGAVQTVLSDGAQMRALLGSALSDTERLDWLEQHPCAASINGLPASAKAYSIVTELPLRAAIDVMRKDGGEKWRLEIK
jgi:hypothetical protein